MSHQPFPASSVQSAAPEFAPVEYTQEVRFAVVMYGGVSLCIYINGVSQELFHLVRASAPAHDDERKMADGVSRALVADEELTEVQKVYRKLSRIVGRTEMLPYEAAQPGAPLRTRFVIDILSGTSAGGINAVFLAKALACDKPMSQLRDLWIKEGDIKKLLNDSQSVKDLPPAIKVADYPQSLLNSERMYLKLLEAFDRMEGEERSAERYVSPYTSQLDLFVTATDLRGLNVPLRLADKVVEENRHRNVFHFRYDKDALRNANGVLVTAPGPNDFHAAMNPLLAFAARCTSAFPFAFEPMKLTDIERVVKNNDNYKENEGFLATGSRWTKFFNDYIPAGFAANGRKAADYYKDQVFADGGYLDNKPFSYAIEALLSRNASAPVDRKLIYIEPSPEHPLPRGEKEEKPDAITNAMLALTTLPRVETIREDLQRVLDRNRVVRRVKRLISRLEPDIKVARDRDGLRFDAVWHTRELDDLIKANGVSYGGYHRLKVAVLTDDLALMFTRAAGFDVASDEFLAIRYFVYAWREANFIAVRSEEGKQDAEERADNLHIRHGRSPDTETLLLTKYDLAFRVRRLNFMLSKIDALTCFDKEARELLVQSDAVENDEAARELFTTSKESLLLALREIKGRLNEVHGRLFDLKQQLVAPREGNLLYPFVPKLNITQETLRELLNLQTDAERKRFARRHLIESDRAQGFDQTATELAGMVGEMTLAASDQCRSTLRFPATIGSPPGVANTIGEGNAGTDASVAIYKALRYYYEFYQDYDCITFPILYSTDVGEEIDEVDVIRISPEDAVSLVDERKSNRHKLAGTALFNFGGFLDERWRRNDILWGRLDGAERIITTMLPHKKDEAVRLQLIKEAHIAILKEELRTANTARLSGVLVEAAQNVDQPDESLRALQDLLKQQDGKVAAERFRAVLENNLEDENLLRYYGTDHQLNADLNRDEMLLTLGRAARIASDMFDDISTKPTYQAAGRRMLRRLSHASRYFGSAVEVVRTNSIWNNVANFFVPTLCLFGVIITVLGWYISSTPIIKLGLTIAVTFGLVMVLMQAAQDFIRGGRQRTLSAIKMLLFVVIIPLVLLLCFVGIRHIRDDAKAVFARIFNTSQQTTAASQSASQTR